MRAHEVRSAFLDFFASRGHEKVHSSSLVPANDPTLLFTNAGMVQFKDVFTGRENREIRRATSSQKCVRAGGKHNDLDEVGKTARHHTFFEMLGNFSFGDYFKEDAISWAWELLTDKLGIDPNRLIVSVFCGDQDLGVPADDEARSIWRRVTGFSDQRILGLGRAENFWMMGDVGPMGPCSEIHYASDPARAKNPPADGSAEAWEGWVEIWNLVFMQYERKSADGPLDLLPAPSIDTGAGLERLAAVLQGVESNYDTDLFTPLTGLAAQLAGKRLGDDPRHDVSMRVIADHARASAFLIADGVFPDKTGREYVLRRIFRRAVRHGKLIGIEQPFMHEMCARVVAEMGDVFPELTERASVIQELALEEERRFRATLDRGLGLLEEEFAAMSEAGRSQVEGAKVFQLYDTFGFPEDLTEIIAGEHGFTVDHAGFEAALEQARKRSRFTGSDSEAIADIYKRLAADHGATEFLGYQQTTADATVLALVVDGAEVDRAETGTRVAVICDRTPFYGEAGGQIGDTGTASNAAGADLVIDDTLKPLGDLHVHLAEVRAGAIAVGDPITLAVDQERRNQIRANHSATHLLQDALKEVLGDHVAQKGSLVAPDRLRFDFSHFNQVTEEQKRAVEDRVNAEVRRNLATEVEVLPLAEARKRGAIAFFGEKYGETVRVVHIGGHSLEFCGGTHVARAGDIGLFKIVSEASVAQGVRRIEAVTGAGALHYLRRLEDELAQAATRLKVGPFEVAERIERLQGEHRLLEREVASLKTKLASGGARDLLDEVKEVAGVKLLAVSTEVADAKSLRETGDNLRDRLGSGVILLAGVDSDKVSLVAMVTPDLTGRFHAGKLLKAVAEVVGGRGGGRPDMAQGGGKEVAKVGAALARAEAYVRETAG